MSRIPDGEMLALAWLRFEVRDGSGWDLHESSIAIPSDLLHFNVAGWEDIVA